jgi:23S rRNA (adenine2030-N6)-methyltransferase
MNYRHIYHVGNFADVLKHAILALVIERLKRKDTAFRVIDTHAGIGLYALNHGPAERTGEWHDGIGRLLGPDADPIPSAVLPVLQPYLDAVLAENVALGDGVPITRYPGSPVIARHLLRRGDMLVANELHPDDHRQLEAHFDKDRQAKVLGVDGWHALKSLLPPKERRGVVLVDPPFEEPGELRRITEGLAEARSRFATGTYLLWYPIKDLKPIATFHRTITEVGFDKVLVAEVLIRPARHPEKLNGCGLILINPPWQLDQDLAVLLPFLARRLAVTGHDGDHRLQWLVNREG